MTNKHDFTMKKEQEEPEEEYLGNIWGWKFSFISLGIILFFTGLAVYRSYTMGGSWQDKPATEMPVPDSLPATPETPPQ